eukprot:443638-Rhodomonas_salina.1
MELRAPAMTMYPTTSAHRTPDERLSMRVEDVCYFVPYNLYHNKTLYDEGLERSETSIAVWMAVFAYTIPGDTLKPYQYSFSTDHQGASSYHRLLILLVAHQDPHQLTSQAQVAGARVVAETVTVTVTRTVKIHLVAHPDFTVCENPLAMAAAGCGTTGRGTAARLGA